MPGQHPSELAQQVDLSRLQGVVAEQTTELQRRGVLIRQLQGAVGEPTYPPPVSVLPSSPADGQEIYFQTTAMAAEGILWHLRYRSTSTSPYKWEFVGGNSMRAKIDPGEVTVVGSGWVDLSSVGPAVTVPLAGDYAVRFGAAASHSANLVNVLYGIALGATVPSIAGPAGTLAGGGVYNPSWTEDVITALAGSQLRMRYTAHASVSVTWSYRRMVVTPVRVG